MRKLSKYLVAFATVVTLAAGAAGTQAAEDPAAVIDQAVQSLFGEFTETRAQLEGDNPALYEMVDRLAGPLFDFGYISKLVMGKSWKSASDAQREDFSTEFKRLMIVTYATALFQYTGNEAMTFGETKIKEKKGRRFATVDTEVTITEGNPIPVVYSMVENADTGWKVYNLTVGDLNMVINYRNVIQSSIHSEGLDGTIASMKANNDRNYNPG